MIRGVGVDVVDVARFRASVARTPGLIGRVFAPGEVDGLPVESVAARFAAKEALAKALGAPDGLEWHDAVVVTAPAGAPAFRLGEGVTAAVERVGGRGVHLSLSHDGGLAVAFVVVA